MSNVKKMKVEKKKAIKVLQQSQIYLSEKIGVEAVRGHSRKHSVPPKLGKLIEMVRSLPPDMLSSREIFERAKEMEAKGISVKEAGRDLWLFRDDNEDRPVTTIEWIVRMFVDAVNNLDPLVKEFIGPLNPETGMTLFYKPLKNWRELPADATLAASENRYDFLLIARDTLRNIADKWASGSNPQEIIPVEALRHEVASTPLSLRLEDQGRIGRHRSELLDWLFDILNDEDVDAMRILRCPICEKIYWAERIDQPTCSPKCNNVRRSRIQRGTYVETRPRFQQKETKKAKKKGKHGS